MAPDPFEQSLQNDLVLLDDKEPRALLRRDGQMLGDFGVEVASVGAVGRAVGLDLEIAAVLADADQLDDLAGSRGLVAEEALFQADLRLRAQVVVQTC